MAFDGLYGIFKRGDQVAVKGQEYLAVKNGMLVSYVDETDYNKPIDQLLSRRMHEVYFLVPFPREMKSVLQDGQQAVGQTFQMPGFAIPDPLKYRPKKYAIDIADFAVRVGDAALIQKLGSPESVPILTNRGLPFSQEILKSSLTFANPKAVDVKSISAGNWNVGTAGDYLTCYLYFLDWTHLTGSITGLVISSITEVTGGSTLGVQLNGYIAKLDNASPPNGDPTAGNIITLAFNNNHFLIPTPANAGTLHVLNQHLRITGSQAAPYGICVPSAAGTYKIEDSILNCGNTKVLSIYPGTAGATLQLFNLVMGRTGVDTGYGTLELRFGINSASVIENCCALNNVGFGIVGYTATLTMRNCFSGVNGGQDFVNMDLVTGYNNASEDSSGSDGPWKSGSSGNLGNLTVTNEFESTDFTNASLMKVKVGGSCANGGVTPGLAANNHGNRKNTRPNGGYTSIGADEKSRWKMYSFPAAMFMKGA